MATLNLKNPTGYSGSPATSTKQGVVRLATSTEAADGIANNVAVTPNQISSFSEASFASPPVLGFGSTTARPVRTTGLSVSEGSNAKQGVVTLVAGTLVVANTSVTANSRIFLTAQSLGTVSVPSALCVSARNAGISFTILASDVTDTSAVAYEIFEPA